MATHGISSSAHGSHSLTVDFFKSVNKTQDILKIGNTVVSQNNVKK